jgi:hypothetical protein
VFDVNIDKKQNQQDSDNYLSSWRSVRFYKLVVAHLAKKFDGFYGNRRFIAAFTRVRYWTQS